MPHDLSAASSAAHLVLYDPAAIPKDFPFDPDVGTGSPEPPPTTAIQQLAAASKAFVLSIPDVDCEATFRIFVNEPLPERPATQRGRTISGAQIEVPSGVLTADGIEFIHCNPGARKHGNDEHITIAPGTYELEVVEQFAWKQTHQDEYVEARTTPMGRRVSKLIEYFAFSWIILLVSTFLIIPGIILFASVDHDFIDGSIAVVGVVLVHLAYLALFRVIEWAAARWPAIAQPAIARAEFEKDYPDILVSMRPIEFPAEQPVPGFMVIRL